MEQIGYSFVKKEFNIKSNIQIKTLIDIAKSKSFSSQRYISNDLHQKAIKYLEENDYFLPKEKEEIEIDEIGIFHSYFKN